MFTRTQISEAEDLLQQLRSRGLKMVTAESCTGGLIAALLTEIAQSSDVIERAFVTYSNEAKVEMVGVTEAALRSHGAVSEQVAIAMASGALAASRAQVAVSVTGIAGPGGGTQLKPVGLVHIAALREGREPLHLECRFGDIGRSEVRTRAVEEALGLVRRLLD